MSYFTKEQRDKSWKDRMKEAEDSKNLSQMRDVLTSAFYETQHPDAVVDSYGRPVWVEDGVLKTAYDTDRNEQRLSQGGVVNDIHEGVQAQMRKGRLYLKGPEYEGLSAEEARDKYRRSTKKSRKNYRMDDGRTVRRALEDAFTYREGDARFDEHEIPLNKKTHGQILEEAEWRKKGK